MKSQGTRNSSGGGRPIGSADDCSEQVLATALASAVFETLAREVFVRSDHEGALGTQRVSEQLGCL